MDQREVIASDRSSGPNVSLWHLPAKKNKDADVLQINLPREMGLGAGTGPSPWKPSLLPWQELGGGLSPACPDPALLIIFYMLNFFGSVQLI